MEPVVCYAPTGADIAPETTYDEWCAAGRGISLAARGSNFWLGDWLIWGEDRWGQEKAEAAIDPDADFSLIASGTLRACQWVARSIPSYLRRADLSWSHHRAVAHFKLTEVALWLERSAREGWTCQQLREAIRAARAAQDAEGPENELEGPERRDFAAGAYDSPVFGEAARLRFGLSLGEQIEEFVKAWAAKHDRALARALDG